MKLTVKLLFIALILLSGQSVTAKNLRAFLNYSLFRSPDDGPYIETYLSVSGKSAVYKLNDKGYFQSIVEVSLVFRQGDKVVDFDKYELYSPEVTDTSNIDYNFLDLQRYFLPEGDYNLEISIADKNSGQKPFNALQPFSINSSPAQISFSGIELISKVKKTEKQNILTKSGYDLVPLVNDFFPESRNELIFYTEIYNSDKFLGGENKFLVSCSIKSFETGNKLKDFTIYKRVDTKPVVPILNTFNIQNLPSGNYELHLEVRDKENNVLATNEIFFQRSNPNLHFDIKDLEAIDVENTFAKKIQNSDTLAEYINSLAPIATQLEQYFIYKELPETDLNTRQQFFFNFWQSRNSSDPEQAWIDYLGLLHIVNANFSTQIEKGYETDRGRVYLKYGPPNIITESYNEPSSYPYEIWQYYVLSDNQRNKKFVFYTTDLIANNFKLLHSDAIGEISNYKWQIFLNNRWFDPYNVDSKKPSGIYGSKADDYFRDPY